MERRYSFGLMLVALLLAPACRGQRPGTQQDAALSRAVDSLIPQVEQATGLKFTKPPRFAVRSKQEVQRYLIGKLDQEYPATKVAGVQAAYTLLELIPDTLDLKALLLPLYAEQVAGYYDPDSTTLYAVAGANKEQLRLVLAHELVHALQHQVLPLDRLLKDVTNADRLVASQAVLEGHATVAMLGVVMPDRQALFDPDFWQAYREQVKEAQSSMPVFSSAPAVIREGLIFPYLAGAEWMRWWQMELKKGPLPSEQELPQSTEQILHPERYRAGDAPLEVRFSDSTGEVLHEDTMGELELQIFSAQMRGGGEVLNDLPLGWGGDRFRVYRSAAGPALVLYTVWDDSVAARRFATGPASRFASHARSGYRTVAVRLDVSGRPAVRIVRAPEQWALWNTLPTAEVRLPEH